MVIGALCAWGLAGFLAYSHAFWGGGLESQYTAATRGSFVGNFFDYRPNAIAAFGVNVVGTLVSPGRGILIGSPFLLVLVPGLRAAWWRAPEWVRSSAAGGVVYLFVQLKANHFGGGAHFWSYRYPLETLTLFAPLFVLSWQSYTSQTARRRATFSSLVVVSVAFQALGAFCFGTMFNFSDWAPDNTVLAVRERPITAAAICAAGYVVAVAVYRIVSTGGSQTTRSTSQRAEREDARVER